jgi:kynurenine formamidase
MAPSGRSSGNAPEEKTSSRSAKDLTRTDRYEAVFERDGVKVSRSPWGASDEIGRLNWITRDSVSQVLTSLDEGLVYDLSVEYFMGMPSSPGAQDPPYGIWMTHTPNGSTIDNLSGAGGEVHRMYSYCGDAISLYTHCGTHIDTLNHLGYFGCFWNGWTAEAHLGSRGWVVGGAEHYPPIIARGVLLDVARLHGVACLPESYGISIRDLEATAKEQKVELKLGDVVLVRVGRMTRWPDPEGYAKNSPGLTMEAARFLCEEKGAMCIGSDSIGLEVLPAETADSFLPVHAYMFATAGAPILEVVWTEGIAEDKLYEFAFLAFPLKLAGATGSPCRPVAMPLRRP